MRSPLPLVMVCLALTHSIDAVESPSTHVFNARDYGAIGDGSLDSPAINQAIEKAELNGGGTVLIPAGTYLCGSIHLKSRINLHLDAGATIMGAPQELMAYDPAEPLEGKAFQDGGHSFFHNSLIWGENLNDVAITGNGRINGGGLLHQVELLDKIVGYNGAHLDKEPSREEVRAGNKAVSLKRCRNVLLRDITIFHGGHFGILATGCDNMTIDNVTIDTDRDGMDIDCCRNTAISNCRVNSPHDDGICLKSTYALGYPLVTENITIVNCQVSGFEEGTLLDGTMKPNLKGTGRIKFGTESSGGFRNCTISNCTFRNCRGLAIEEVDGGILEDISISNLTMVDTVKYALYITTGTRHRTPDLKTESRARNILISNMIADGGSSLCGIQITGLPGHPIEGVRLDNIRLTVNGGTPASNNPRHLKELGGGYPEVGGGPLPAYGINARHVRDLEISNFHLNFTTNDCRPAIWCEDIDGLSLDHVTPQVSLGIQGALLGPDIRGLTIQNSPTLSP
jgi:Right handed beta helix region